MYTNSNSLLYELDVNIVGCGATNANQFPMILQTATVRSISIRQCINLVSNIEAIYLPFTDQFLCTVGYPYTFLNRVSNVNISYKFY
jgi:hypothetical protein